MRRCPAASRAATSASRTFRPRTSILIPRRGARGWRRVNMWITSIRCTSSNSGGCTTTFWRRRAFCWRTFCRRSTAWRTDCSNRSRPGRLPATTWCRSSSTGIAIRAIRRRRRRARSAARCRPAAWRSNGSRITGRRPVGNAGFFLSSTTGASAMRHSSGTARSSIRSCPLWTRRTGRSPSGSSTTP